MSSSITPDTANSTATSPNSSRTTDRAARNVLRSVLLAWVALAVIGGYGEVTVWTRALHPPFVPLAICLISLMGAELCLLINLIRLVRRRALYAMGAVVFGLAPVALVAWPLAYAARVSAQGYSPSNRLFRFATMFGGAAMHAEARRVFPHRRESARLVMYYSDAVSQPEADLRAMDAHVSRLEKLLGRRLRDKIWWVRGPLFGRAAVSFLGLSLGSSQGSATDSPLDRHELAHAVIEQSRLVESDPPALLVEGWAEAQSGADDRTLAVRAWEERKSSPNLTVRSLVEEPWYHRDEGPVYTIGGAYVAYLLRRLGPLTFLDLYVRSRPSGFAAACPLILGVDFDTLERDFWKDTERIVRASRSLR